MQEKYDTRGAIDAFDIPGNFVSAAPYGDGHINDTYTAVFEQGGRQAWYIVQRVNHNVFKDVPALMRNIERVCEWLRTKLVQEECPDILRRCRTLVPAKSGGVYHLDAGGNFWRVFLFIENAIGCKTAESEEHVYEAARAFGEFQRLLADMPGERLNETIPGFHDTPARFMALEKAVDEDRCNRASEVRRDIESAFRQKDRACLIAKLHGAGVIPERVAHNDTKLNNVLIDEQSRKAVCVIDLDTVMPGLSVHDFGDFVRSSSNSAAEDERDTGRIFMRMPMFEAAVRGFMEAAGAALAPGEISNFGLGAETMTVECGIRFLADYLRGDVYFKTRRAGQNLDRFRAHFKLLQSMQEQENKIEAVLSGWL